MLFVRHYKLGAHVAWIGELCETLIVENEYLCATTIIMLSTGRWSQTRSVGIYASSNCDVAVRSGIYCVTDWNELNLQLHFSGEVLFNIENLEYIAKWNAICNHYKTSLIIEPIEYCI